MPLVARTIEINARPSAVWRWLATAEALRQWISPNLRIDLSVGGTYDFVDPRGEIRIAGHVLEIVPEGRLVLSWQEEGWLHPGRLVITLEPTAKGCRVGLIHDGFAGIGKPSWRDTVEAYERGADRHKILERLAELVSGEAIV